MKRCVVLSVLLAACGGQPAKSPALNGPAEPGRTYDVSAALSAALDCPVASITWSIAEAGCGSVAAGLYTSPACGSSCVPGTAHVTGTGCGKSATLPVQVAEAVQSVSVCGVASGSSCCAANLSLPPGGTAQFYATVTYSCPNHIEYSPSAPPAACP